MIPDPWASLPELAEPTVIATTLGCTAAAVVAQSGAEPFACGTGAGTVEDDEEDDGFELVLVLSSCACTTRPAVAPATIAATTAATTTSSQRRGPRRAGAAVDVGSSPRVWVLSCGPYDEG
jgi:hypothetical protein